MNDVDALAPNYPHEQPQQVEIQNKLFRGRTYFGVDFRPKRADAMNFGVAYFDVGLSDGVSNDVHVVPHISQGVGHFANTGSGTVVGRERTCGYHRDRIAFRSVGSMWCGLRHVLITMD